MTTTPTRTYAERLAKKYLSTWRDIAESSLSGANVKLNANKALHAAGWLDKTPLDILLSLPSVTDFIVNYPRISIHPDFTKLHQDSLPENEKTTLRVKYGVLSSRPSNRSFQSPLPRSVFLPWTKIQTALTKLIFVHGYTGMKSIFDTLAGDPSQYFLSGSTLRMDPFRNLVGQLNSEYGSALERSDGFDYWARLARLPQCILEAPTNLRELVVSRLLGLLENLAFKSGPNLAQNLMALKGYPDNVSTLAAIKTPTAPVPEPKAKKPRRTTKKVAEVEGAVPATSTKIHQTWTELDTTVHTGTLTLTATVAVVCGSVAITETPTLHLKLDQPIYGAQEFMIPCVGDVLPELSKPLVAAAGVHMGEFMTAEWNAQLAYRKKAAEDEVQRKLKAALSKLTPEEIELLKSTKF